MDPTEGARSLRGPECGVGTIELVLDGMVGRLMAKGYAITGVDEPTYVMTPAPFGACNFCEFCIEVNPRELRAGRK